MTKQTVIKVAVVGANGYGGIELVRLLAQHPNVSIEQLISRSEAGQKVVDVFPHLAGESCRDLTYIAPQDASWETIDLCFFATPHTVAMEQVASLLEKGIKVIDLSADFRLKEVVIWEQWYATQHTAPSLIDKAVYGLPELNRSEIQTADLVACPGCYPTAAQLGLMPLLQQRLLTKDTLIIDAKSGISGAGRGAKVNLLFSERSENFEAYATAGHRHYPEIKQQLTLMQGEEVNLIFTPHLLPTVRGIHATIYAKLTNPNLDVQPYYEKAYADEPFVCVLAPGNHPQTKSVAGTNQVQIAVARPPQSDYLIIMVVEDNLIKGASGQAVQCMNLMWGLPETTGLLQLSRV